MSLRIDTTEWIAGSLLIGETGLGVLGSAVPAAGDSGPGYAYNDLSLPADNNKEICGRVTTWPAAGTLTAFEDTSFIFDGAPDGGYTFQYQLYVDGVATGAPATVFLTIGVVELTPAVAAITLAGYAPTLARTDHRALTPTAATAAFAGYTPTLQQTASLSLSPAAATVTLAGYAPELLLSSSEFFPATASTTLTGYAPTLGLSAHISFDPPAAALTFSGHVPALFQGRITSVVPAPATISVAGLAPDMTQTDNPPAYGDAPATSVRALTIRYEKRVLRTIRYEKRALRIN